MKSTFLTIMVGQLLRLSVGLRIANYQTRRISCNFVMGLDDLKADWTRQKSTDTGGPRTFNRRRSVESVNENTPSGANTDSRRSTDRFNRSGDSRNFERRDNRNFERNNSERSYTRNTTPRSSNMYDMGDDSNREPVYGYFSGDHVYGISPVRLALQSRRREITELLMQEGMDTSNKKDSKAASDIVKLCTERNIPIREFSKHNLNMLTDSRPHQGFVLRASPLQFSNLDALESIDHFSCALVLDEVWDPQNFGALLRTSHFLGVDKVIVCAKNSAPLSPSVSKASSGAMELMTIYSVNNLMRFLDKSHDNGWQVVGTALDDTSVQLNQMVLEKPTILVLGNEGHGIRTNILRRCDQLIKIPFAGKIDMSSSSAEGVGGSDVDSLNVSVSGGIILHHILSSKVK